jgi:hypothetical protein
MNLQKRISLVLLTVMFLGQFGLVGGALAAKKDSKQHSTSSSAAATPSASPSPSPSPSDSPSPSPSPSPSAQPTASGSSDSSDSAGSTAGAPSGTAAAAGAGAGDSAGTTASTGAPSQTGPSSNTGATTTTGAQGCQGEIPTWVFNSATQTWASADQSTFTCDATTGYYLSPEYYYNKQSGWYEIIPASSTASLPSYYITAPNVIQTALGNLVVGSPDYQMAQALGLLNSTNGILTNNGSGSSDQVATSNTGQNWVDLTSLVNVINTLQSAANSGNTTASSNTQVGDSATGAATVIENLFNLLSSAWSWSNGNLNFFMQTICAADKTCNGDVNLDPSTSTTGGGQIGTTGSSTSGANVNAQNSGNITNNVNLAAQSGDANATDNTSAGNVSSGNALAEVNIMNLINSFITSGSSFFGVLNIYGTLNGNILFPAGFLDGLVPSGTTGTGAAATATAPNSTNDNSTTDNAQSTSNTTSDNDIANNVATTAASGAASANSNTTAGNVGTGLADTMQSLFNLANTSIFGNNAVLVIVNVAGHWIGKIMDVPGDSSESALLTGGATIGTNAVAPNSTNLSNATNTADSNMNTQNDGTITNNVNIGAQSGSANASDNTQVGNVNSGNAQAGSTISNIVNSVVNVKHWFGVLVINVIGSWFGNIADATTGAAPASGGSGSGKAPSTSASVPTAGLLPDLTNTSGVPATSSTSSSSNGTGSGLAGNSHVNDAKVLTAAAEQPATESVASITKGKNMSILFAISAGLMLLAGALVSIDKKLKRR